MEKQMNFSDLEYGARRKKTKRDKFLKRMNEIVPWEELCEIVRENYYKGRRGRKPQNIERMIRMFLLRQWFGLSDSAIEDAAFDSYAMKQFLGVNFSSGEQVPDAATLYRFRKMLSRNGLDKLILDKVKEVLAKKGKSLRRGSMSEPMFVKAAKKK